MSRRVLYAAAALLSIAVGCGDSTSPNSSGGVSVSSIAVNEPTAPGSTGRTYNNNASLPAQATFDLKAIATLPTGTTQDVTTQATWTSSNTAVATVTAAGQVTVNRRVNGTTTISASYGGKSASFQVSVAQL